MKTVHGTWPESYEVQEDPKHGIIRLGTPYYAIEHDCRQGGGIAGIRFKYGSGENVLLDTIWSDLSLAGTSADQDCWPWSDIKLGGTFSDAAETSPKISLRQSSDEAVLTFAGMLRNAAGKESGVTYQHAYTYRWGYVRVRKQFHFPAAGLAVSRLRVHCWRLRPDLGHYGVRPGAPAEASSDPGAFGVCQWGRFQPGAAFDCPYESRFVPRYVVAGRPGCEGLEWFVSSDLVQWDYQVTGAPGFGGFQLVPRSSPPAICIAIAALDLPRGDARLQRTYTFDSCFGFPIISGRAQRPFLHRIFNRKHWPTEETVQSWAERGVRTAHFHHDGDTFKDGLFWRDGKYPPFAPEDMAEFDRVIERCHRHGIRVATYFSNKELYPTVEAYQQHGKDWARLPGDRGEQLHNLYSGDEYGIQMCLRSGWFDYLKQYIDTVLTHHALDGVYYDWNLALYCHNPSHTDAKPSGETGRNFGALALSPAGHWDMDELLALMEWTRQRVGPDGLVIIHNTMVPCAATENFADYVVAMEWGYGRLAAAAPAPADLPLEWNFLGARSRAVIGRGCLVPEAPETLHRQMTLRCLLTGTVPWPVTDLDLEIFAPLMKEDFSAYRFADWSRLGVHTDNPALAGAVYHRPDEAVLLLGNLTGRPQAFHCLVAFEVLTLRESARYQVVFPDGTIRKMTRAGLAQKGIALKINKDGLKVIRIIPL